MLQFPGVSVSVQQSSSEGQSGTVFFCKSFVKIRNTDVGKIPVACDISSHVALRFYVRKSATSFTLYLSVDVFGLPGLGS